jgi:hypothetical protein
VPTGGALGYVLTKASSADYNTIWSPPSGGGGVQYGLLKASIQTNPATGFMFTTAVYSGTTAFTLPTGQTDGTTFTLGLASTGIPLIFTNVYIYTNTSVYINNQRTMGLGSLQSSGVGIVVNSAQTTITFTNVSKANFTNSTTANDSAGYSLYFYIMLL